MKNPLYTIWSLLLIVCLYSCSVSHYSHYNPRKKFGKHQLEQDYELSRQILEAKHPSLYWYTSKDSMDFYFDFYRHQIKDSMTEPEFTWQVLAPLVNKIHCGHTSVEPSKPYEKWLDNTRRISFPYMLKVWNDTMVITAPMGGNVLTLKRGTVIKSINGMSAPAIIAYMLDRLPSDGYARNANLVEISGNFPELHREIFGLSEQYNIQYTGEDGVLKDTIISAYFPDKDSTLKKKKIDTAIHHLKHQDKWLDYRSLDIDSIGRFAYMKLNTFSEGRLRRFFKKSFKQLHQKRIDNLIIDLRYNGGGDVALSTLFTQYLTRKPFRVADSAFNTAHSLKPFTKYYDYGKTKNWGLYMMSSKAKDHRYHVKVYERKFFKPLKRYHYDGKIYIIVSGPTFSASTLVANAVRGQEGITLIGEETGGGAYGNSGILIPMLSLPHTNIRLRMPLFRLVQYLHRDLEKGHGIMPDIVIPTSHEAIINGYDKKLKVVKEIILHQGH